MKICKMCKVDKGIGDFGKSKLTKDGREGACRACRKAGRALAAQTKQKDIMSGKITLNNKICSKCKQNLSITLFSKDSSRGDGFETKCRECRGGYYKGYYSENIDTISQKAHDRYLKEGDKIRSINKERYHSDDEKRKRTIRRVQRNYRTPAGKFSAYKSSAKQRNIIFNLSFDDFKTFLNSNCTYCKTPIELIGIDRVDSSKGYNLDNCVACCATCNYMKNDLTLEAFKFQTSLIYNNISY